jgi:hypothetical protein
MALTVTTNKPVLSGAYRQVSGTITFDSSYATGGKALPLSALGMYALTEFEAQNASSTATNAYVVTWNRSSTAPTLKVFQGDNANAAAAPLIEVPNATNLATLVCTFTATGY